LQLKAPKPIAGNENFEADMKLIADNHLELAVGLKVAEKLSDVFSDDPLEGHVHIIVIMDSPG
jgi:hypothetical protein